jgi:AcrR family transcriptional regulator
VNRRLTQPRAKKTRRTPRTKRASDPKSAWAAAKEIQRDARRDAILRAATRCINERGYTGASMAIIADALGVSYNALYHYFESKEEILAQAFLRTHELIKACVQRSLDADGNGMARFVLFIDGYQHIVSDESPPAIAFVGHLSRQTVTRLIAQRTDMVRALATIVEDGQKDGSMRAGNASVMTQFFFGALENAPYWRFPPETMAAGFASFARHALGSRAERR